MDAVNEIVQPVRRPSLSLWRTGVVLFKLRIVSLLVLSAFGGAGLGTLVTGRVSGWSWVLLALTGTLSAAGASGINQYLERERDSRMNRTAARPLATGQIENPHLVLLLGVGMVLGATALAAAFNLALAFWVFLGAVIYVGVYTVWLKPRTTLNIVIGGAAGSCAVISGGAAVGAWSALGVWILAALVFVWTPVHFWALALAYRADYIKADYPMLPARVAPSVAARWTAVHTVLTASAGMALGFWPAIDWVYLVPIGLATAVLVVRTIALLIAPAEKAPAFALFHFSNLYLALVLVVVLLASLWR
jgi:protoheme IX farnesyltransferase